MAMLASTGHSQFEIPYGPSVPSLYALIAQAHMGKYGTTSEQFAAIAVACRKHASLNPNAQMRDLITVEDVLNSRRLADPLHLLDCSLISYGGSAVILTSAVRASDFPNHPVYILGVGKDTAMSILAKHAVSPPLLPSNLGSAPMKWLCWVHRISILPNFTIALPRPF
ncbi:acetyl-CoA acetyltransferase [Neobacillus niacini]|nr:thiolase family protein [Neobacillus niacini]MDR7075953.1 acetyl-CoA acetyltransferase [Neobacillus niacini]